MVSPSFYVGLMCSSIERLREAIIEYSVRNTVEIKMARNDKIRVRAHCAEIRPQNLYASYDTRARYFVVKTYYGKYNCKKSGLLEGVVQHGLQESMQSTLELITS